MKNTEFGYEVPASKVLVLIASALAGLGFLTSGSHLGTFLILLALLCAASAIVMDVREHRRVGLRASKKMRDGDLTSGGILKTAQKAISAVRQSVAPPSLVNRGSASSTVNDAHRVEKSLKKMRSNRRRAPLPPESGV